VDDHLGAFVLVKYKVKSPSLGKKNEKSEIFPALSFMGVMIPFCHFLLFFICCFQAPDKANTLRQIVTVPDFRIQAFQMGVD
jgi:hypothetical protein